MGKTKLKYLLNDLKNKPCRNSSNITIYKIHSAFSNIYLSLWWASEGKMWLFIISKICQGLFWKNYSGVPGFTCWYIVLLLISVNYRGCLSSVKVVWFCRHWILPGPKLTVLQNLSWTPTIRSQLYPCSEA